MDLSCVQAVALYLLTAQFVLLYVVFSRTEGKVAPCLKGNSARLKTLVPLRKQ
jgi:hypothetical protein